MDKLFLLLVKKPSANNVRFCIRQFSSIFLRKQTIVTSYGIINNNNTVICHKSDNSTTKQRTYNKALQQQSQSEINEDVKPAFEKVKETTKTATYLGVILLGLGVTGIMIYAVFKELFSSKSPNNVYAKALERVSSDTRVKDALGEPISGYGEENKRGRRQHVSHLVYEKNGEKRLRMKFYVSGSRKRATVHLEMRENESGNYEYRYLFAELDDFGRHPIVFEDNRIALSKPQLGSDQSKEELDLAQPLNMNLNFPDAELK